MEPWSSFGRMRPRDGTVRHNPGLNSGSQRQTASSKFFRIRNVSFNSNPQNGERFSKSKRKDSLENREGNKTIPLSSRGYDQPSLPEIGWLQLGDKSKRVM